MFFDLAPAAATVNDTNARLVTFHRVTRERPEALVERLRAFEDPDAEQAFAETDWGGNPVEMSCYQQRARFNRCAVATDWSAGPDERLEEAALLLYLNRTCYNGLYRESGDGGLRGVRR